MPGYRDILLRGLIDHGWEQAEIIPSSQWWVSEFWRIRSTKQNWGFELFLTFAVDLMADLPNESPKRASAVWKVAASEQLPDYYPDITEAPAMPVRERQIHEYLEEFLEKIDEMRRGSSENKTDA